MNITHLHAILAQPKGSVAWSGWQPRGNHAGHLIGTSGLVDHQGVTIPGLTMQLEVKAPVAVVSCLYLFSLMQLTGRTRSRVYQLEVAPSTRRTHNGRTTLYGPHEHLLTEEPTAILDAGVNCDSWEDCAAWFFLRTSINAPNVTNPFEP